MVIPLLTIFSEIESSEKGTLYFSEAYFIVSYIRKADLCRRL